MAQPDLSLVLPIYNEGKTLSGALDHAISRLEEFDLDFELLCVDDGSTDDSGAIAIERTHRDGRVRAFRSVRNLGKGAALQRGIQAARGRWVATLDADLSTDLEVLPSALRELELGAAIAIGDRHQVESRIVSRQPWPRALLGKAFSTMARLLVSASVADFTCGFKAYRRDAAQQIFTDLETTRWAFDVEVIAIARSRGMRIKALPVAWSHRSDTRVRFPFDALRAFVDLLRIGWLYRFGVYR
jgi:dolichyl-phosphate beta-glucosyltransferase